MTRKSRDTRQKRQQSNNRGLLLVAVGILSVGLILVGGLLMTQNRSTAAPTGPARVGAALPNFKLTDLSGRQVQLSDYTGHPVLVNAWATWCPPCRAEMPALHDFYLEHQDEGFTILAVNAGEAPGQVQSFIQETGFTFPVLLDPDAGLLERLGIRNYPTSVLVGRDGTVKTIHVGMLTADQLEAEIAPLLQ